MVGLLFVAIIPNGNLSAQTWPAEADWVHLIDKDWNGLADPDDQQTSYLDIVVDASGFDSYILSDQTYLYFRIGLQGSPLQNASNLKPFAWLAVLIRISIIPQIGRFL